jgi:hypothetical protein
VVNVALYAINPFVNLAEGRDGSISDPAHCGLHPVMCDPILDDEQDCDDAD